MGFTHESKRVIWCYLYMVHCQVLKALLTSMQSKGAAISGLTRKPYLNPNLVILGLHCPGL